MRIMIYFSNLLIFLQVFSKFAIYILYTITKTR